MPFEDTQYTPNMSQAPIYESDFEYVLENEEDRRNRIAAEREAENRIDLFDDEISTNNNVAYLSDRAAAEATPGRIVEARPETETAVETIPFDVQRIRAAGANLTQIRHAA